LAETWRKMIKAVCEITERAITRRILVAEDNKTIQEMVFRFLKHMGLEVALADNGVEALAVFQKSCFDLVLSDFQMPVMDGFSLAGHIKKRSPGTPVIMMTGSDRETVRQKMDKGAVESVLFKPFKLEDLRRAVQGVLASREREHGSPWPG
jgi:CheY-like chemotaxis protein